MTSFTGPGSLGELAGKDRFGDRIHFALAIAVLVTLPVNGKLAGTVMFGLVGWGVVRMLFWRAYLPSAPRVVMIPALVWVGFLALSLAWSSDLRTGWHQVRAQMWLALIPLLWPLMDRWRSLLVAVLAGTVLQATFHAIAMLLVGIDLGTWGFAGLDTHPRRIALWYAAGVPWIIVAVFSGVLRNRLWLAALVPICTAILLSESRAAVLAVGASLLVVIPLSILRGRRIVPTTPTIVLASVALAGSVGIAGIGTMDLIEDNVAEAVESFEEKAPTNIRLLWWRSCVRQWPNHPVLGYGLGGTARALETDSVLHEEARGDDRREELAVFNQPHSAYFQTLVEGGVVGILILGTLLGTMVAIAYRNKEAPPLGLLGLSGLICWIVASAFDQWQSQGQTLAVLWFSATLAAFRPSWLKVEDDGDSRDLGPDSES